ncbi:hypothetical protein PV350_44475 [Streptomyces sp. PA03-6a]|nr:hypothetical protein [Streptomyces sp. PA03-6a]
MAGDSDGSDDGATAVGDEVAPGVAGGDGDDVTVVGEDVVADKKAAALGNRAVAGSGQSREEILAWLTGQSDPAGSYKAALLDLDSRFPAEVTVNSAMPRGLRGIARGVDRLRGPSRRMDEAARRHPEEFNHYRRQLAVRDAGDPAGSAARLFLADAQLRALGVDVFALEWAILPDGERAAVRALVDRWVDPDGTAGWTDRDWGAVAMAHRVGEAVAAATILRVVRSSGVLRGHDQALVRAGNDSERGKAAVAAARIADVGWADGLRALGVDVFALEWAALPDGEKAAVRALVGSVVRVEDTRHWTERHWGAVAVAGRFGGVVAAFTSWVVTAAHCRDAVTAGYYAALTDTAFSDYPATEAARIVKAGDGLRAMGVDVFSRYWALLPDGKRTAVHALAGRPDSTADSIADWTDRDWGAIALTRERSGDEVAGQTALLVAAGHAPDAVARYQAALRDAHFEPAKGAAAILEAGNALRIRGGVDVFVLEWRIRSAGDRASIEALAPGGLPGRNSTAGWGAREWGAVTVAWRTGDAVAAAVTWRIAADRAGLPVPDITSLRIQVNARLASGPWSSVDDATVARHYVALAPREAGGSEQLVATAIAKRISDHNRSRWPEVEAQAAVQSLARNWLDPGIWPGIHWERAATAYRVGGVAAAAGVVLALMGSRHPDLFRGYRQAQAAAMGGPVEGLLEAARQLKRVGVDVFRLEWAALPDSEKAEVTALGNELTDPENTADWGTRDWGAVAVARRSGPAAAAAVLRHVLAERAGLHPQSSAAGRGLFVGMALVDHQAQYREVLEELRARLDQDSPDYARDFERVETALGFVDPGVSPAGGGGAAVEAGAAAFGDALDSVPAVVGTVPMATLSPGLGSGGVPRPVAGRVPGVAEEGAGVAGAVAGGSDGSDDGATVVGDEEGANVADGDADDGTVVGDDGVPGGTEAKRGSSSLPGSGGGHDKVRAWLTGQRRHTELIQMGHRSSEASGYGSARQDAPPLLLTSSTSQTASPT